MIRGGTVVDGDRRAPRRRGAVGGLDRRGRSGGRRTTRCPGARRRRAASSLPGLVDLHTHLREPGRRGGRDGRDRHQRRRARRASPRWWPCPTPNRRSTRRRRSGPCSSSPSTATGRGRASPVRSPSAAAAERLAPMAELPRSGCGCSPTTARGAVGRRSCGVRSSTRADSGSILAEHCEDETLACRWRDARGRLVEHAWVSPGCRQPPRR